MSWFLAPYNTVFAAAFAVLCSFALLEAISLMLGLGISDFLSDLLGLPDGPDAGAGTDGSPDADGGSSGGGLLSWLEIGKVPVLVSVCAFLGAFSIGGMLLQQLMLRIGPGPLIQPVAGVIAFFAALPLLKWSNRILGRIIPQDESSAFAPDLLIGRVGLVTIGTALPDRPAEVKVVGPDGRSHYVMSFAQGEPVPQGGEILLERRDPATGHFHGIRNDNPNLSPSIYL